MSTWAIVNQKGGVGKTSVTICLGAALAHLGFRVLVVDFDPQASATKVVGAENTEYTMTDLMFAPQALPIENFAVPTDRWGFDIAPSAIELARREQSRQMGDEQRLRKSLVDNSYDVVLVDCPPSLGVLTANSLVAADYVLIVSSPAFLTMRGLTDLLLGFEVEEMGQVVHVPSTIEAVKENYNPDLVVAGHVVNMMDVAKNAKMFLEEMVNRQADIGEIWEPPVARRAAMNESHTSGLPLYDLPSSPGNKELIAAFEALALRLLLTQGTTFEPEKAAEIRGAVVRRNDYWLSSASPSEDATEENGTTADAPQEASA